MNALLVLVIAGMFEQGLAGAWNYSDQANWPGSCAGSRQSPINIDTDTIVRNNTMPTLKLHNFNNNNFASNFVAKNNGHSISVTLPVLTSERPAVSGGALDGVYHAIQFHWHWGTGNPATTTLGSEHTFDDESCDMEIHIVCLSERFATLGLGAALDSDDGSALAVVGICIVEDTKGQAKQNSIDYETILPTDIIDEIPQAGDTAEFPSYKLSQLLPTKLSSESGTIDIKSFYTYDGSLTTPGCNEQVVWNLVKQSFPVEASTLAAFRAVENLAPNYRAVQPLNGRTVSHRD